MILTGVPEIIEPGIRLAAHGHRTGIVSDTPLSSALKLADALALIGERIADEAADTLSSSDARLLLGQRFADRPYVPGTLLGNSDKLGIRLSSLAEIYSAAPSPA